MRTRSHPDTSYRRLPGALPFAGSADWRPSKLMPGVPPTAFSSDRAEESVGGRREVIDVERTDVVVVLQPVRHKR